MERSRPITAGWCLVVGMGTKTLPESTGRGIMEIAKAIHRSSDFW
ncbi:MAG: hypothetical protein U9N82_09765 [Thermodesulfobacteriota bacterium]|nr:hypothetical protein [Thermodesulfobacteriota bacterium]